MRALNLAIAVVFSARFLHPILARPPLYDWHPPQCNQGDVKAALLKEGCCCAVLSHFLGGQITYPNSTVYNASIASYWSLQEASLHPTCVFEPTSAQDISLGLFILTAGGVVFPGQCEFAIRSGGHTPWAGAANIQSGITIDLRHLNELTLTANQSIVRIGPANRWNDVYSYLVPLGLATSGGRVSIVGVGGLVLGGGVSFFTPRYGFVGDNVENFEVVLASGRIVNANATSNPDLWRALRGGSNNFGIVTAFDMRVFQQGDFWGGFIGNPESTFDAQFSAFEQLDGNYSDPYASLINSYLWSPYSNSWFSASNLEYTRPQSNPPIFQNFTNLPQIFNTMRISNLSDLTSEIAFTNPAGRRQLFATGTYGNSAAMMRSIFDIANATAQPLLGVQGLAYSISFQPLPTIITEKPALNGSNSLGLDPSDGNLFTLLLTISWANAVDDDLVNTQAKALISQSETAAQKLNKTNPYIYLNYAAPWQGPISGYGAANKAQLQAVSRKYDPWGVFQNQVPGGFKLFNLTLMIFLLLVDANVICNDI